MYNEDSTPSLYIINFDRTFHYQITTIIW